MASFELSPEEEAVGETGAESVGLKGSGKEVLVAGALEGGSDGFSKKETLEKRKLLGSLVVIAGGGIPVLGLMIGEGGVDKPGSARLVSGAKMVEVGGEELCCPGIVSGLKSAGSLGAGIGLTMNGGDDISGGVGSEGSGGSSDGKPEKGEGEREPDCEFHNGSCKGLFSILFPSWRGYQKPPFFRQARPKKKA